MKTAWGADKTRHTENALVDALNVYCPDNVMMSAAASQLLIPNKSVFGITKFAICRDFQPAQVNALFN